MIIVKMLTALALCAAISATAGARTTPAGSAEIEVEATEAAVVMNTATVQGVTWYLVESEAHLRAIGTGEYGLGI